MEIIVLFAIIGIVSSIIRNVARTQQPPPVVHRKPYVATPEVSEEPVSLEGRSLESTAVERYSREDRLSAPNSYASQTTGYQSGSITALPGFPKRSAPLQVESLEGEQMKKHELDLSESGLLSGIILSEVLGPPKALRK